MLYLKLTKSNLRWRGYKIASTFYDYFTENITGRKQTTEGSGHMPSKKPCSCRGRGRTGTRTAAHLQRALQHKPRVHPSGSLHGTDCLALMKTPTQENAHPLNWDSRDEYWNAFIFSNYVRTWWTTSSLSYILICLTRTLKFTSANETRQKEEEKNMWSRIRNTSRINSLV